MNIEELCSYCLSLPYVYERMPWINDKNPQYRGGLCFYVGSKWFCFFNIDNCEFINIKLSPDMVEELRTRYDGVRPGWHMNKKYWNSIYLNRDVPDKMIKELIRRSYDIVLSSLPKKEKDRLQIIQNEYSNDQP